MSNKNTRVVVALSGGVDSSVAAHLLVKQGYDVVGIFMKNWHDETVTVSNECPWVEDSYDAMIVAEKLSIPFQTIDLSKEYQERIIDYMFSEYKIGNTPNPDVLCNREIKFDVFLKIAKNLGADYVATGHYCRVVKKDTHFSLLSGKDLKISQKSKNELIKSLSICAGHTGLAGGQYSDLTFENKKISKKNIINMQKKKTGELFGFCCESVAIVKGLSFKKRKKIKEIGINVGLLFQIVDDLIDHKGDSKIVGKPTKSDKKKGKATLINLLGYKETLSFAKNLKKKIDIDIKKYGTKANDLLDSVNFILERKF